MTFDLTPMRRAFLQHLAEETHTFDYLVALFGLSEVLGVPTNPAGFAVWLTNKLIHVNAPSWADAGVRGAASIVAGKAAQSVQLFLLGRYPPLMGKKPQGKNRSFFIKLTDHYISLI